MKIPKETDEEESTEINKKIPEKRESKRLKHETKNKKESTKTRIVKRKKPNKKEEKYVINPDHESTQQLFFDRDISINETFVIFTKRSFIDFAKNMIEKRKEEKRRRKLFK
eukprot:gene6579-10742_t